jgi:CheY-like chemotaxis protein
MSYSILVVDDDVAIVEFLEEALSEAGYTVRCAFDGQAALDDIAQAPPDVVLSDVAMPRLDGVSLVHQLARDGSAIPVILTSAASDKVDVPDTHFVSKPFDLEQMLRLITHVLADHAPTIADDANSPG